MNGVRTHNIIVTADNLRLTFLFIKKSESLCFGLENMNLRVELSHLTF